MNRYRTRPNTALHSPSQKIRPSTGNRYLKPKELITRSFTTLLDENLDSKRLSLSKAMKRDTTNVALSQNFTKTEKLKINYETINTEASISSRYE